MQEYRSTKHKINEKNLSHFVEPEVSRQRLREPASFLHADQAHTSPRPCNRILKMVFFLQPVKIYPKILKSESLLLNIIEHLKICMKIR